MVLVFINDVAVVIDCNFLNNCCVVAVSDITYKSKYAAAKDTQGTTFMPFATPKNLNTDGQKQKRNGA